MMNRTLTLAMTPLALGFAANAAAQHAAGNQQRPNVVLILADDMGYSDLGCFGSEIRTPNLDRLAREGLRMTEFYNAGRSCPSRAALLTGLYPSQTGVGYMVDDMGVPAYQGYLNRQCVTIAEVLQAGGYATYMAGKWHVGETQPHWPLQRGFDRYFGLISGASHYFYLSPDRQMAIDNTPYVPEGEFYMTDAFTDHAVGFLQAHDREKPFFLYLAYTAPHWPLHAFPEDIEKYRGKYLGGWDRLRAERYARMRSMGLLPGVALSERDGNVPAWDTLTDGEKDRQDLLMAVYAAMIDRMDQNIGRVLAQLKAMGADRNTLVIFLSDNGACQEDPASRRKRYDVSGAVGTADSFEGYGYPWANAGNTPFRKFKRFVHEGGISTPLIAWYPAMIPAGTVSRQAGHIIDVMPTLAAFTGCRYPEKYQGYDILPMEGENLIPAIEDGYGRRRKPLFWEHEGNRALREGDWKLVSYIEKNEFQPWELYNIAVDRSEEKNLATTHPERLETMIGQYQQIAKRVGVVPRPELLEIRKRKQ